MSASRRQAIRTIAGATTGLVTTIAPAQQHQHADSSSSAPSKVPNAPLFFTAAEYETVAILVDLIIPRTGTPGARDAFVHASVDDRVKGDTQRRTTWREGLAALDARAGSRFATLPQARQVELLTAMSNEPESAAGRKFFELVKGATIDLYYETREGLVQELGYHCNVALTEFKGCTHPEHQA